MGVYQEYIAHSVRYREVLRDGAHDHTHAVRGGPLRSPGPYFAEVHSIITDQSGFRGDPEIVEAVHGEAHHAVLWQSIVAREVLYGPTILAECCASGRKNGA